MSVIKFPQRNLAPESNNWARTIERVTQDISQKLTEYQQATDRAMAGVTQGLNLSIDLDSRFQQAQDDLTNLQGDVDTIYGSANTANMWHSEPPTEDDVPSRPDEIWRVIDPDTGEVISEWYYETSDPDPETGDIVGTWVMRPMGWDSLSPQVTDSIEETSKLVEAHEHRLDATEQLVSDTKDALDATDVVVDGLAVEVTRQQVDIQQAVQDSQAAVQRANAAVTGSVVEYALSSSRTVAPTSGWTTSTVTPNANQVVWFRTVVTYGSGQTVTLAPAVLTGPRGEDGAGIEIAGSVATYADLPTNLTVGDAGKAYLVEANGLLYIWDGAQFPTEENGVEFRGPQGDPGAQGPQGVGIESFTQYFASFSTEWAGEEGASESILKMGGVEVARSTTPGIPPFDGSTQPYPELVEGLMPPVPVVDVNEPTLTGIYPSGENIAISVGRYEFREGQVEAWGQTIISDANTWQTYVRGNPGEWRFYQNNNQIARQNGQVFAVAGTANPNKLLYFGAYWAGDQEYHWSGDIRGILYDRPLSTWEIDNALDYLQAGGYLEPPGSPIPTWSSQPPPYDENGVLYETWLVVYDNGQYAYTEPTLNTDWQAAKEALFVANLATELAEGLVSFSAEPPADPPLGQIWMPLNEDQNVTGMWRWDGSAWATYTLLTGLLVVPTEDGGQTIIGPDGVEATQVVADILRTDVLYADVAGIKTLVITDIPRTNLADDVGDALATAETLGSRILIDGAAGTLTIARNRPRPSDPLTAMILGATSLDMVVADKSVAYIDSELEQMSIPNVLVRDTLQVGAHQLRTLPGTGITIFQQVTGV